MKTLTLTIKDDFYLHNVEISHQFDSDVTWTDIVERVGYESELLRSALMAAGYRISDEDWN